MIDKTDPTNRDTVPAMLTPGEFVLNKEASTMFAPVIEQMNAAGLQHRAMKNMGGGIQNYNDGGYSFMKPTSKFRGALKDLEADSYSTLFANSEKKETPWKGVDITGMSMAEVLALVKPNGAFHKYNKDNFDKNTTAVGKYQFVGSTLRDLKKRGVFEKLGIDDDTPFNESTQDALAAYLAVHRVKDRTKGTMSSAREELRNEWEGFKKLDDNQLDDIINEISGEVGVTLVGTTPQVPTQSVSVAPITSIPPQMRPKDLAPQMTTGTIDTMASSRPQMRPNTQADPISIEQAIMQTSVPQVQAAPPAPTDFGEAFKDARADMGAGGIFTFRGRDYTTDYAEEDKTMTANMGGSVYLNMGGYPQGYLDNYLATMDPEYLNRIEQMSGIDAVREVQAQVRPDYTNPDDIEENFAASMDLGRLAKYPDHNYKSYYLSQPGTGMTTEESIAKRKNLTPNSYVPMPEVNSDESLLQGSSGSVASAARSFPSGYPINMDVPRVEGYNIPAPIPAPRPTMLGGQLYYLNGDGLVTDSNGNPVQDPEIGAAVQDKLNYSPEESAANAQAYNESMAEQAVFNGVAPQSVNPSYDSMRQQQESNAAEAERIRAEVAQIDMERQALNDEFNNREPVVVPPLERGPPLVLESFVPDVPAYEGELGGLMPPYEGELGGGNMPLMREDIVQAQQVLNPYDFNPYGNDPMGEIPKLENSDGYTNEELRVLSNTDNAAGSPWAEILQERTERQASELRSELQEAADNGIVPTQSSLNQLSDLERQSRNASEVKAVNDQVVAANQQSVATTNDALGATERERKLRAIERAAEYGITVGDGSSKSSEDVTTKVEGIINNLPEDDKKTSKDQDLAAKEAAAAEEARLNQAGGGDAKNTPEVKGAMSAIKSMFGDLFDTKELLRAAILYLGGRATGLNGNQALAFAGKNYLARVDAKEGTYQKIALEGKHTKDSLAVYKKTMNPADLVAKGQPAIETGDYKDVYHTKSGTPVKLIEKETSTGRKLYYYKGEQVDLNDFTTDGRYSVGSKDHDIYVGQLESAVISQVKELQEINMTDSDSNGKGSKPIIGITPTGVATQAAKYVIKNQLPREVMRDLVSIAYKDAVAEKKSTGKTPSSLEPFFEKAYVKSRTSNVVNFTLGNGKPAPAASVNQFFRTIRDMATAAEQVENPDFKLSSLNDTQLSTWLLQSKTYTSWNQITDPEEKKFFVDRGAKEVPPRSGFMQYVLEGYPKTS